LRTNCTLYRD